ncbi:MAG: ArsC family reductase [Rhodospirillales bacterium]|nr:ArsC family reductase [Rhodospirillales bacterium]
MITVYGIKNCDTCRKALKWLKEQDIRADFHDLRADGLDRDRLENWIGELGFETLLNRRGTTWRNLAAKDKDGLDEKRAARLMLAHPTLIKRPLFDLGDCRLVGFTQAEKDRLQQAA